jgi:hypothetical protein
LIPGTRLLPLATVAALLAMAPPLLAQERAPVSLGIGVSVVSPTSDAAQRNVKPALLLRLQGTGTVGPSIAFSWFSSAVRTAVGGDDTDLGKIVVRPVMAGVALARRSGRVTFTTSLESGYAFVQIRDTGAAKRAYERLGAAGVGIRASGTLAWRTMLSAWYDISDRHGVVASVGYLGVRPEVTTSSSLGESSRRVNLGSVVVTVGVSYALF